MIRILMAIVCGAVLLVAHGPVFSQEAPDTDGDGWTDGYEFHLGTSPALRCIPVDQGYDGLDAWPPDLNRDNIVDIFDIAQEAQLFGNDANYAPFPPGTYRYDIYPEPMGDGVVDIFDMVAQANLFGRHC